MPAPSAQPPKHAIPDPPAKHLRQHTSAYVSIRQHMAAYVSIHQHTSAHVSTRQHTSTYVSIRQHTRRRLSACIRSVASLHLQTHLEASFSRIQAIADTHARTHTHLEAARRCRDIATTSRHILQILHPPPPPQKDPYQNKLKKIRKSKGKKVGKGKKILRRKTQA